MSKEAERAGMIERQTAEWSKLRDMNKRQRDHIERLLTGFTALEEFTDHLIYRLELLGVRTQDIRKRFKAVTEIVRPRVDQNDGAETPSASEGVSGRSEDEASSESLPGRGVGRDG